MDFQKQKDTYLVLKGVREEEANLLRKLEKENNALMLKKERRTKMILNVKNQLGKLFVTRGRLEEEILQISEKQQRAFTERDLLITQLISQNKERELLKEKLSQ